MPTREYHCDGCGHHYEEFFKSIADDNPLSCPSCDEDYDGVFRQVYGAGIAIVYGQPTTFGQQAEINAKKMGKEQMSIMAESAKLENRRADALNLPRGASKAEKSAETPWFRSGSIPELPKLDKPLNLSKVTDVQRYIETGNK